MMRLAAAGFVLVGAAAPAMAEVVNSQVNGFEVRETTPIAAPPDKVWLALGRIGDWWDREHTLSGDAHNLTMTLKVGGCWCESLEKGGVVEHMRVIRVSPDRTLGLGGALGPLQTTGAAGHIIWSLAESASGTALTLTYDVGGYAKGGLASWAKPVDTVLSKEIGRLKRYVESGAP